LGELLGQDFPSHCGRRLAERNRTPGGIAFRVLGTAVLADPGLLLTEVVIDTEEVERSRDDGEILVLHIGGGIGGGSAVPMFKVIPKLAGSRAASRIRCVAKPSPSSRW
jgi:hypothetical protein